MDLAQIVGPHLDARRRAVGVALVVDRVQRRLELEALELLGDDEVHDRHDLLRVAHELRVEVLGVRVEVAAVDVERRAVGRRGPQRADVVGLRGLLVRVLLAPRLELAHEAREVVHDGLDVDLSVCVSSNALSDRGEARVCVCCDGGASSNALSDRGSSGGVPRPGA